jgi:hypothetical protein
MSKGYAKKPYTYDKRIISCEYKGLRILFDVKNLSFCGVVKTKQNVI